MRVARPLSSGRGQRPGESPTHLAGALNRSVATYVRDQGTSSEEEIIARARGGDRAAFGALYDRYVDRVYRYVYYRVRDEAEGEDVTSEVFIRAMVAMPRFEPRQSILAWLYRIARNEIIDRARSSRVRKSVPLQDAAPDGDVEDGHTVDPATEALASDRRRLLRDALAMLPADQQDVIVMRFVLGLGTAEIGAILGKRESTVRGLQMRGLRRLRLRISPDDLA